MLKKLFAPFLFIYRHPLTESNWAFGWFKFLQWQLAVRVLNMSIVVPWVNDARLIVRRGMAGATGNYYCGLHEFHDMSFLMHFLRPNDLFVDVGANVGTYSILASKISEAKVISIEPIPKTYAHLIDNIGVNHTNHLVDCRNIGIGAICGALNFSSDLDAENHVVLDKGSIEYDVVSVPVYTLDTLLGEASPIMIKVDVEGFELEVLRGGKKIFEHKSLKVVLIELNGSGNRYSFSEEEIRQKFRGWGFESCKYDPFKRQLNKIDMQDVDQNGNTLYVRDFDLVTDRVVSAKKFEVLSKFI